MSKIDTISYQGKDYATVPARLKEFRGKYPRASIETTPSFGDDGSLTFKAVIIADKADEASASATGHAFYTANEMEKAKSFEKLETVATGRALSLLGFLNNGEVASTEEMQEFEQYQEGRKLEAKQRAIEALEASTSLDELKSTWASLGELMLDADVKTAKDKMKGKFDENSKA